MAAKDIIKWVIVASVAILITALAVRIHLLEKRLEQRQNELEITQKSLEMSQQEYKILCDKNKRDEQSLEALVSVIQTEQNVVSQRLECVEESEDAHDWLDDILPDSVRMCFDTDTADSIQIPDTAICAPGTL